MNIHATIGQLLAGQNLSMQDTAEAIGAIVAGQCNSGEIATFLTALRAKGEMFEEVAGAAQALRAQMTVIETHRTGLIDTCGTGGDGSRTFNISTAAAIVTAAAGVPVAKHGNRGMTSRTGSADVLATLGVNVDATVTQVERCLNDLGLCFCFAPLLHQSMKHVSAVRKQLGVPTIFNMLGPLANPARAQFQLVGVGRPELRPLLAKALNLLGTERAIVVHGEDGIDEVSLAGATQGTLIENGQLSEFRWMPEEFGLQRAGYASMLVDGPAESAVIIERILAGEPGPARDIVVLNAAAALWTARRCDQLDAAANLAARSIDSGEAASLLKQLVALSNA
jgi:anthranilate phosphoribosyltransferase